MSVTCKRIPSGAGFGGTVRPGESPDGYASLGPGTRTGSGQQALAPEASAALTGAVAFGGGTKAARVPLWGWN